MKRQIIKIDADKCNGCEACVKACHEGAIGMVNGKAVLLRDDYCDGLGDCLPACPTNAISFEEREAAAYDEEAVRRNIQKSESKSCCSLNLPKSFNKTMLKPNEKNPNNSFVVSQLYNWPIQLKLAPTNASYFNGAKILLAADCTAFAYGDFHDRFMKNHISIIACPKLDSIDYSIKLTEIIKNNDIKSIKLVRMEVPCCSGLEIALKKAVRDSGKILPWSACIVSREGNILEEY